MAPVEAMEYYSRALEVPVTRRLMAGILGVWSLGTFTAGVTLAAERNESFEESCGQTDISCHLQAAGLDTPVILDSVDTSVVLSESQTSANSIVADTLPLPQLSLAEKAVESMNLTPEGYASFMESINYTFFDFAQQYIEFNPTLVPISQNTSSVFVWHFTVLGFNGDGVSIPADQTNVGEFIRFLATRYDESPRNTHLCCGVNWFIDRNGGVYQLAPLNAKLRHNPPFDEVNTGVEVEAANQDALTSAQYESLSYLSIAVLQNQTLLGNYPIDQIVKGHGEMRDTWNAEHPEARRDSRDDFDAPISQLLRQKIAIFLQTYPEVTSLTKPIR